MSHSLSRRGLRAMLALGLLSASLLGCGGGGGGAAAPAPPAPPAPEPAQAPQWLSAPADQTVADGQAVVLTASASGTAPIAYQWLRNGLPVDGATEPTLRLPALRPADDGARYRLRARNAAGEALSAEALLRLALPAQAQAVTGCQALQSGGRYRLGADVGGGTPGGACLRLEGVSDVLLDCDGHRVLDTQEGGRGALALRNARNVSVRNCGIETRWLDVEGGVDLVLRDLTIGPGRLGGYAVVNVADTRGLLFDGNRLAGTYQQFFAEGSVVRGNQVRAPGPDVLAGLVVSNFGAHTQVVGNVLDGNFDATRGGWNGGDDGVVLVDERDAEVRGNEMRNLFDCGIEWVGLLSRATLVGNRIDNAAICGLGGWYWASLEDTLIADNEVQRSPRLFLFMRFFGLRAAGTADPRQGADTWMGWRNNRFERNRLAATPGGSQIPAADLAVFGPSDYAQLTLPQGTRDRLPLASEIVVSGNLFKDNDFGVERPSPAFAGVLYPGAVQDGGGNRCQAPKPPALSPLRCGP